MSAGDRAAYRVHHRRTSLSLSRLVTALGGRSIADMLWILIVFQEIRKPDTAGFQSYLVGCGAEQPSWRWAGESVHPIRRVRRANPCFHNRLFICPQAAQSALRISGARISWIILFLVYDAWKLGRKFSMWKICSRNLRKFLLVNFYLAYGKVAQYGDQRMCMSVCMSVCLSAYNLKNTMSKLHEIL